jgi:hypothetical protein
MKECATDQRECCFCRLVCIEGTFSELARRKRDLDIKYAATFRTVLHPPRITIEIAA